MMFRFAWLLVLTLSASASWAGPAPFDLAGPVLDVKISRGATTLPVSQVPNLAVGDRIWLKADFPRNQAAHYLLVAAFLRGSTNPPPESWFFSCKTWTDKCATLGMTITVPQDAQQVLLFLAPQTGGDFKTLMSAVRGRPGAFVRTSQDLNQAAMDRSRLERYLATIRQLNSSDPTKIAATTPLLARSLAIKVDDKCLDRLPELQAPCLMQGQESLILNDGHSTSIVEALTSGPGSDLAMEASYTPQLSYGYYSPYIASVLDIARIFDSFSTAQYQYIPALASQHDDKIALTLNTAPSFHNPMSVLVAALPAVEKAQLPPLHAVNPTDIYCARKTQLVLPVEGAPLVFSTSYAHDVTLTLTGADGKSVNLPATPDATQGGYVVDTSGLGSAAPGDSVQASLRGYWGFDAYQGPRFRLMNAHTRAWELAAGDEAALVVGRRDTVHLRADSVSCVDNIMLKDPAGKELKADWKSVKPNEVEIKLPLEEAQPGALTLMVSQYGVADPQPVPLQVFAEAGRFDGFSMHAGDDRGLLKGSRLDEVASLSMKGVTFVPGELSSRAGADELPMVAQDGAAASALKAERGPADHIPAKLTLKDGRTLSVSASIEAPRPKVSLLGKNVQPSPAIVGSNIMLNDSGELAQDATLIFSIRAQSPTTFARDQTIDVATGDDSATTTLSIANGGLALETSQVAVATLNPAKAFGASTFGPLKFRIDSKGIAGDWQPLANLVRLPVLKELKCPSTPELACKLVGSNLYLIDSISGDVNFTHAVNVPDGYLGNSIPVPHPIAGPLYVKLRDNPQVVNPTLLTVQELPHPAEDADRSESRNSALHSDDRSEPAAAQTGTTAPTPPSSTPPGAAASAPTPRAASGASTASSGASPTASGTSTASPGTSPTASGASTVQPGISPTASGASPMVLGAPPDAPGTSPLGPKPQPLAQVP